MLIWIAPVLLWLSGKAQDYVDFLRSIPDYFAPKPTGLGNAYVPPFTGGQCPTQYRFAYQVSQRPAPDASFFSVVPMGTEGVVNGAITSVTIVMVGGQNYVRFLSASGEVRLHNISGRQGNTGNPLFLDSISFERSDNLVDSCGNVGNPVPPPAIPDSGLFSPTNTVIANNNGIINPAAIVLAPALPLGLVGAVLAGYGAAMAAAAAAGNAVDAIKKVAEGLDALKDLWEKLREFLNEWDKNRPKKRDTIRQTYGKLVGDGALDFFPSDNQKYQAIQLDVVIINIPIGFGRYFGSFSPHRYRYKELGYISFYSTTQGILETHSIQFRRTSLQIPKLAVGFIYHLGLDNQVTGFAFGSFSVEKS